MWSTIGRARRRLDRGATRTSVPGPDRAPAPEMTDDLEDVVIVFVPDEVERLRVALQHALGDTVERPDTPARIERALSLLCARRDVTGRPRVVRRPAAVSNPESWEIHLDGVDQATAMAVRSSGRTGRLG